MKRKIQADSQNCTSVISRNKVVVRRDNCIAENQTPIIIAKEDTGVIL
jgi:hypothetical protein